MKNIITPLRLSDNEISLQNALPVQILCKGVVYDVLPGATIYLEDKAQYSIHLIEDDQHQGERWPVLVQQTNPAIDTVGRVVINMQAEIAAVREQHLAKIDREAEATRGQYITLGSGQAMVYQQKLLEARLVTADPEIEPNEIPHVVMEAMDEGVTVAAKAAEIIATADAWTFISAEIERRRLSAKRAVRAAQDLADVDAASIVDWEIGE